MTPQQIIEEFYRLQLLLIEAQAKKDLPRIKLLCDEMNELIQKHKTNQSGQDGQKE